MCYGPRLEAAYEFKFLKGGLAGPREPRVTVTYARAHTPPGPTRGQRLARNAPAAVEAALVKLPHP